MSMDNSELIELGGQLFRPVEEDDMVFEQFAWVQNAAQAAGLGHELMDAYKPFIEELNGDRAELTEDQLYQISEKIIMRAFEGRAYLRLLAGVLVPEGKPWTRNQAEQMMEYFAQLKGPDIGKMHQIIVIATIGFFTSGLKSLETSQNSSLRRPPLADVDLDGVTLRPKMGKVAVVGGEDDSESGQNA